MKKSANISLGLLAATALVFTSGCRNNQPRNCVDANNRLVDPKKCEDNDANRRMGYGGGYYPYHAIYGGSSGGHVGDSVVGGSTSSSAARGGFGSSFGGGGE